MDFYNTNKMGKLLKKASQGDVHSIDEIQQIHTPFSISKDYSDMVLVQRKYATTSDDGRIKWLNSKPNNSHGIYIADIYTNYGGSWTSVPLPNSFSVEKIENNGNIWSFISYNKTISGTLQQIEIGMRSIVFSIKGSTANEIEQAFLAFPSTAIADVKPRKTLAENPPVNDSIIGILTFNKQLQWFETKYEKQPHSFQLSINVDERTSLIKVLPIVIEVINNIHTIDTLAKQFATNNLLELKNNTWLEKDDYPLNEDDFIKKLTLGSISFDKKMAYTLSYNNSDLFWGHTIGVDFMKQGKPKNAQIQG